MNRSTASVNCCFSKKTPWTFQENTPWHHLWSLAARSFWKAIHDPIRALSNIFLPLASAIFAFSSAISFNIFSTISHLLTTATLSKVQNLCKHLYKSSPVIPRHAATNTFYLATFQSEDSLHIEGHLRSPEITVLFFFLCFLIPMLKQPRAEKAAQVHEYIDV